MIIAYMNFNHEHSIWWIRPKLFKTNCCSYFLHNFHQTDPLYQLHSKL